jgi:hypothetical protein
MATTALDPRTRQPGVKAGPDGFVKKIRALHQEAMHVLNIPPKERLGLLTAGAPTPAQRARLAKEIAEVQSSMERFRQDLEKAIEASEKLSPAKPLSKPAAALTPAALVAAGVLIDTQSLADLLKCTRQALSKAVGTNRMFYIEHEGTRYFPVWFGEGARYRRQDLEAVSKELGDLPGGAKLQFFMTPKGSFSGATPLEALAKGKVDAVLVAARGFAES